MLDWIQEPSLVPNGTVVALLIACAAMVALVWMLALSQQAAQEGGKFLMNEALKSAARESILLKALSERQPEDFERTLAEFRTGPLSPSQALVYAIRMAGGHHA